jgi:hypothetical protein
MLTAAGVIMLIVGGATIGMLIGTLADAMIKKSSNARDGQHR